MTSLGVLSRSAVFVIAVCTAMAACDVFGPEDDEPASIEVYPSELSMAPGDTAFLDYTIRNGRGVLLEGISVDWKLFSEVASINSMGRVVAHAPGMVRITAERAGVMGVAYAAIGTIRFDNVRELAIATYRDVYGLELTHPAIAPDSTLPNTNRPTNPTRFISVVHGDTRVRLLELWPDGRISVSSTTPVLRPIGEYRVAVVVVDYPYTNIVQLVEREWKAAADSVNAEHENWARAAGLPGPLLHFRTTTLVASPGEFDPLNGAELREYLATRDVEYDIRAVINLDAGGRWGGLTYIGGDEAWVYVGCHCSGWRDGSVLELKPEDVHDIARTLYHHEIGHLMGWLHKWGGGPPGTRLITDPSFFGWTDLTGNGWSEILSPTPYGSRRRFP